MTAPSSSTSPTTSDDGVGEILATLERLGLAVRFPVSGFRFPVSLMTVVCVAFSLAPAGHAARFSGAPGLEETLTESRMADLLAFLRSDPHGK